MRIVYKENIVKPIGFITAALLLTAIGINIAHTATLLSGPEINPNTLVRDAYVHVIYSHSRGRQESVKGWIDSFDDNTLTIRNGDIKNRTIIAYHSVIAVIMSDESTVPIKKKNDVNRFLRQSPILTYLPGARVNPNTLVRDAYVHVKFFNHRGKRENVKGWISVMNDSTFTIRSRVIGNRRSGGIGNRRSGGIGIRTVINYDSVISAIMSDGSNVPVKQINDVNQFLHSYAHVTYSDPSGEQKVVKGWVALMDDNTFTIRSRDIGNRTVIPHENIISLVTVILTPPPIVLTPASGITHLIGKMDPTRRIAIKMAGGFVVGVPLARLGLDTGSSYSKKLIGFMAGYTLGVAVGVSMVDPYDQFASPFVGSFIGAGAGMGLIPVDVDLAAMAVVIFPIIGAVIGSELSRRPPEASYFSVGLAPDRNGNLSAIATLRF